MSASLFFIISVLQAIGLALAIPVVGFDWITFCFSQGIVTCLIGIVVEGNR